LSGQLFVNLCYDGITMKFSKKEIITYTAIWFLVSIAVLSVAVWFSNREAIIWMFSLSGVSLIHKFQFLFSFYGSLETNFSVVSATSTILVSILFGLTIVLFIHYVRIMRAIDDVQSIGVTSLGGLISGFFGIGCASCGSVLVLAILSQFGAGGLLLLLPFGGEEFGILAVALLGYSVFVLQKKIRGPRVCGIE